MWQLFLAAAVAGSGFLIKRFRDSNSAKIHFDSSSKPSNQILDRFIENSSKQCQDSSTLKKSRKKSGFVSQEGGNDGDEKCRLVVDLKKSTRRFVVRKNKKNKMKRSSCRHASENCPPKGLFNFP